MAGRKTFITYCSKEKDRSDELLPAIRRYTSKRIDEVEKEASKNGADLWILSGKYGLIRSTDPIPFYDERLKALKVDELVPGIAKVLKKNKVKECTFFMRSPQEDPGSLPYLECLGKAAEKAKVEMNVVWI